MSNKRKITYKCPYCDKRFNKEDLVSHVGDKHDDMIPEGYSAFRLVFDYVNKKPAGYNGKCIICGNESGWDENKGKYNRICSNPACKKKYIQSFEERMMKSKGVTRISSTADGQAKMLANRKISGEYKFQDGGIRTYTGTYEKKALEFMDKVMDIQSIDVTTPGPILEYDFEGKTHIYISDIYYAPYNLIIEVKDGGNNPNMRSMPEYRAKQIAKEKYIIKNTDYNYLRLTNNDFSQLLAVFMELKMEMSNDTPERVIRINEGKQEYIDNEAKWIDDGDCFICSKCGKAYGWTSIDQVSNFCPECGRKMIAVIKESKEYSPSFKSDEDLLSWMKNNISYSNFTKLKSHDEVLKSKKGSCHDQVMFEYEELKKLGYSPKELFIIELDKNGQGGMTHSLVYYKKGNKICWFENAWKGQEGIGEHDSLNNIKDIIRDMYNNYGWGNIRKYGHLEFKTFSISSHKPGESLQQFVDICFGDHIKENYIEEGFLKSEPDILYNKEAFDNGDINICFITGHSGSGKSTLAHGQESETVEVYELDDLQCIADRFTMTNLKEYGDLIYTYFKGPGKQFYTTWDKLKEDMTPGKDYEDKLYPGFVAYAIDWAKKHKDKKYIIEGVWLFCNDETGKPYFDPSYFKDYAFYIKGTSAVKSKWRAAKRDMKYDQKEESHNKLFWFKSFTKSFFLKNWKWYKFDEKRIQVFRDYFKSKPETVLSEAYTKELGKIQKDPEIIDSYGFISSDGIYNENVKIKGFDKWLRGRSELLIIDKGKVYLKKDPKKGYSIPGGGWEKDEDHNLSAIRETNEEARIKVKNVNYVSSYVAYFPPKDWVKEKISEENWWYGEYIELYIGEYDGQYKGEVEKIDQDKAMESGKFYDIKSVYNDLIPVHQEALSYIINEASISDYTFLDIKSNKSKALKYLKSSTQTKDYADDIIKNYVGEIVLYNDEMIGRIFVGDKKDKGFITDFEISEEHRGNKLGSKLIDDAIIKYHGIDLLVDKDNKIAIDMYKKRGFVVIKTVKNQYWMKLKSEIKEDTNMTEAMNALMTGYIPGSVDNPNNVYIVNYMQNNVFSDEDPNEDCIGVSDNPKFTNLIVRSNGVLKKVDESFLKDKTYKVYILEMSRDEVSNRLNKYMNTEVDKGFIYETLTGHKLYTNDQIQFESMFIPTVDYYEFMESFKEICDNYFQVKDKKVINTNESTFVPEEVKVFNKSGLMEIKKVHSMNDYISAKPSKVLEYLDISIKE